MRWSNRYAIILCHFYTDMKRTIYWIISLLWLNILVINCIPWNCLAQFWGDPLWLVEKVDVIGTDTWPSSSLLDTISSTIKWILGILATVALCICLYAWFKMLTSWGDSKSYDAWWTILNLRLLLSHGLSLVQYSGSLHYNDENEPWHRKYQKLFHVIYIHKNKKSYDAS